MNNHLFFSYITIGEIMKKTLILLFSILLSFFLIHESMLSSKKKDPIFLQIEESIPSYEVLSTNGMIQGNDMIVGKNGMEVDVQKSYQEMKKYGSYNESLTTMKKVSPSISMIDHYDKYLIQGNFLDRKVSFVFPVFQNTNISKILSILETKDVVGTFFLDGTFLEKNTQLIRKNSHHEYEILSYDNSYQKSFFQTSLSYLETITKKEPSFCYAEKENKELLTLCQKLKKHTIKPQYILEKDAYLEIQNHLEHGMFFSFSWNPSLEKELPIIIDYIHSKGYKIVPLKELLQEE